MSMNCSIISLYVESNKWNIMKPALSIYDYSVMMHVKFSEHVIRVKSGNFGHRVKSDILLQTV